MNNKDAIERCKQLIKVEHANWIGISNQIAIATALDLIEQQQAEIDKYKEMCAVSVADRVNSAFKQEHKNNEDLEMLYKGCQIELEKEDKIIDLMAEWFEEWAKFIDEENYYTIFRKMSKEDIKEYFF